MTFPSEPVDLRSTLTRSIELETIAASLRATTTPAELVSVWWSSADHTEGDVRIALQDVYAEHLEKLTGGLRQ